MPWKNLHLRIDNDTYERLKEIKEKMGYKSWEEFITRVVFSMSEDEIKRKRIEQLKEKLFDVIDQLELLTDKKYELELIRVAIVHIINDDKRAVEVLKQLFNKLGGSDDLSMV